MNLMQGNTYRLPIKLKMSGQFLTPDNVSRIEFTFGKVVKHYPEEVVFEDGRFVLPLSQEDTFSLGGVTQYQARVLFSDRETVKSTKVMRGNVSIAISKVVLE